MGRKQVPEDVEKFVERHRAQEELLKGESVSFGKALRDILFGEE